MLALSGYGQTAAAIATCVALFAVWAFASGRRRLAGYAIAGLILTAITVYGLIGIAIGGICDTNCPSGSAELLYKVMFYGGIVALLLLLLGAIPSRSDED